MSMILDSDQLRELEEADNTDLARQLAMQWEAKEKTRSLMKDTLQVAYPSFDEIENIVRVRVD